MHQLIRVVTTSYSHEDATSTATGLFEHIHAPLIDHFDYGQTMNEGGRGSEQMPEIVQETGAVRADTEDGRELVESAWKSQSTAMNRYFNVVEEALSRGVGITEILNDTRVSDVDVEPYSPLGMVEDEEEYSEQFTSNIRFAMYQLGKYAGPDIYLYSENGEGVRRPDWFDQLCNAIDKRTGQWSDEQLPDEVDWYVVPVDVHF